VVRARAGSIPHRGDELAPPILSFGCLLCTLLIDY